MTPASLQKLWLVLAVVTVSFSYAVHAQMQGGPLEFVLKPVFGVLLKDGTPQAIAAMWGITLVSLFSLMANYVLVFHAEMTGADWKSRYPFRLFDFSVHSPVGSKAQKMALLVLTVAPMISFGHFWRILVKYGVLCTRPNGGGPHQLDPSSGPFGVPESWTLARSIFDEFRLADERGGMCKDATTWFPMVSPLLLAIVTAAAIYMFVTAMTALFRAEGRRASGI